MMMVIIFFIVAIGGSLLSGYLGMNGHIMLFLISFIATILLSALIIYSTSEIKQESHIAEPKIPTLLEPDSPIIQISSEGIYSNFIALCKDGSVWRYYGGSIDTTKKQWAKIKDGIPLVEKEIK